MLNQKERHTIKIEGQDIDITNPNKLLWPAKDITKLSYIGYLAEISPHILPFLKDRTLTVIRYPHGVGSESFYQKSCPNYAPQFIPTHFYDGINYIVCSDLSTLIWLGNQNAIDFHIPFNTIYSTKPSEIILDLDPPSRDEFSLAIEAALMLKEVFDKLDLTSFIKTSGNKGLQIYIPLPENQYTYIETRLFTEFIANYLTNKNPNWFTIERLKKNRGNRLYVDYLQHSAGKTIIAPYSVRGNDDAVIATPLFWNEVNNKINPTDFTMEQVRNRINDLGCPFSNFQKIKETQNLNRICSWLKELSPKQSP